MVFKLIANTVIFNLDELFYNSNISVFHIKETAKHGKLWPKI